MNKPNGKPDGNPIAIVAKAKAKAKAKRQAWTELDEVCAWCFVLAAQGKGRQLTAAIKRGETARRTAARIARAMHLKRVPG